MDKIDFLIYMPGTFKCQKCGYQLQVSRIDSLTGQFFIATDVEPQPCPKDGAPMEPVTWKDAFIEKVQVMHNTVVALEQSVKTLSEYAKLLNFTDHGDRPTYANMADWLNHLSKTGKLQDDE